MITTPLSSRKKAAFAFILAGLVSILAGAGGAAAQDVSPGDRLPAAQEALIVATGGEQTLSSLTGDQGTVLIFWSNQCPWVSKYEDRLRDLASNFSNQRVSFVLVNSNDAAAFPQETLEVSRQAARQYGSDFTYVMDPSSRVARAFGALRTPHVFVFDGGDTLVYEGAIDDSPGDPSNVNARYLHDVLTSLVQGTGVRTSSTDAFGCTIKLR